ncbi:MAG: LysR family transcriptional regulator [Actinomycetota bacterium]|nr:LysR family transcriptional regulator [Actinomycetota bacterium]
MDIEQLRAFCAAVECGSFSAAARRLGRTQPGVSRQVQRLEAELGTKVLARTGGGVRLTVAGERLLAFARRTLLEYEALRDAAPHPRIDLRGDIRVVASSTPGEFVVPDLVVRFRARHPKVTIREWVTDSSAVPAQVLSGESNVGFSGLAVDHPRLRCEAIAQDEIVLAVPATHPLASRSAVRLDALAGERLILRQEGSGTLHTFLQALAGRGLSLPAHHEALRLASSRAVLSAVEAGLGIGLLSARALHPHLTSRAQAVRLVGLPVVRSLYLLVAVEREPPPQVAAFVDFVLELGRGRLPDEEGERTPRGPSSPASR